MSISQRAATALRAAIVWDNTFPFAAPCGTYTTHVKTLDRMRAVGYTCASLTVCADFDDMPSAMRKVAHDLARFRETEDRFIVVRTVADVEQAKRDGRLAVVLNFQGTMPFERNVDMVEVFYKLGVRQVLMAYNQRNHVADGCHERTDAGLSSFGREVVREMERVGMLVDCTHTGYRSSMEVLEMATRPVVFSHSNPRALHDHERNITDEQARACARTGGVIGVNGLGHFLGGEATAENLFRHIDYLVSLVGGEHVGFSLDYISDTRRQLDVIAESAWRFPASQYTLTEIPQVAPEQIPELAEIMLRHGYPDDTVSGVLGGNWLRVARIVWK